jgi:hypothetical protein
MHFAYGRRSEYLTDLIMRLCECEEGEKDHERSFAFRRRSSCGVNRRMTDNTRTRLGRISLFSRNWRMTLRRY